jgi:phage terminase large subunit
MRITDIQWVNDRNGYIKIYEVPNSPKMSKYCIGGDIAGDGSDYFTAHVINAVSGVQCAVLKQQFDEDLYTKQLYCLGWYYNSRDIQGNKTPALIGIEANFSSFPILELQRLGYTNQYVRTKLDEYTGKTEKKFGFKTTVLTRPTIIANLIEIVREHTDLLNDRDTLEELLTIIRNEKGRIEAPQGGHDDQMMGLAIAYEVKSQVTIDSHIIANPLQAQWSFEETAWNNRDYGERISII